VATAEGSMTLQNIYRAKREVMRERKRDIFNLYIIYLTCFGNVNTFNKALELN
jgi:hypothetical protein